MNKYKLTKAGINVKKVLGHLNNNSDFLDELLRRFCKDKNFENLKNAMENNDVKQAFQYAHALKGISGNLSMERLYGELVPMTEALRHDDLEGARPYLKKVSEAYEVLMSVLRDSGT